jgi:hypothetical protein
MNSLFKEDRIKESKLLTQKEMVQFFLETYLDLDFQRWTRWASIRGFQYFSSVIDGLGNVEIRVVCVNSALEYSKEINHLESFVYFTKLKKDGYKYVSLDGNSRTTWNSLFISGFTKQILDNIKGPKTDIHNKNFNLKYPWDYNDLPKDKKFTRTIALMTKKSKNKSIYPSFALYQIKDEKTIKKEGLIKYNGNKKIELDKSDINNLIEMYEYYTSSIKFNIEIWGKITKPEMHNLFIHYNLNEIINRQDIRNAFDCGMSNSVRNISPELSRCFEQKMNSASLLDRTHHEMVGFCMYYLQHETSLKNGRRKLNASGLDKFWKETRDSYFSTFENEIWNTFIKLSNTQTNSLNHKALFVDIFAIAKWMVQNKIATSLIDADVDEKTGNNKGWERVMKLHAKWMEQQRKKGNIYKVGKGRGDWAAYRGGIGYFTYRDKQTGVIEWSESLELFLSDFLQNNKVNFFVIKDDRTANVNTPEIRLALWNEQKGIDTLTGLQIPFSEVYNTDRTTGYEVDHDLAIDNGGTNDFENLRLVGGIPNAKKSNKIDYEIRNNI